jgi:hypothetical protein
MAASVRFALTVVMYVAVASAARAQATEPSWTPDEETVKSIEATLTLPSKGPWEPGPLGSYARYYTVLVQNGIRVIYGDLLRGRLASEKPGIYLRDPPDVWFGGGCDQIQLWYDVEAHHMLEIHCYGLG